MSSLWPPARASLDDSFGVLCESVEELKAAKSVDIEQVLEHLTMAAGSAQDLRTLVSSEMPEAAWQNREELDTLLAEIEKRVEARAVEQRRSRLLALASVLKRGSIVHRRALRVEQLNQLRDQAVKELRSQAGPEGTPKPLPGPEAAQWMDWACGLQEPEDAESLQAIRQNFPSLDDFVANLEPGMWSGEDAGGSELRRSRLLALAAELERGSIVHHRALRVEQLNQLRDEAIKQLRSLAEADFEETPQALPGPEAGQWIEWACALKEPEDAESLRILRSGFAQVDDFIANLEPNMWKAGELPAVETPPEPKPPVNKTPLEKPRLETNGFDELVVTPGPIPIRVKAAKSSGGRNKPRVATPLGNSPWAIEPETPAPKYVAPPRMEEEAPPVREQKREPQVDKTGFITDMAGRFNRATPGISSRAEKLLGPKWRMLLGTAAVVVVVLAVLGAVLWRSHKQHASNKGTVEAAAKIPDVAAGNLANNGFDQGGLATTSDMHPATAQSLNDKSKAADQNSLLASATKPGKPEDVTPRPALEVPQNPPRVKKEDTASDTALDMPASVPGGVPNQNAVVNIAKSFPTAQPKMAPQQVKVSSGVAEGLLIHQVKPQYPSQARQAHIQGTVVLQAVIGKDGSVQSVKAIRGPSPMLTQAAVEAVKQWKYKPYSLNGEAVEAETEIDVKFSF